MLKGNSILGKKVCYELKIIDMWFKKNSSIHFNSTDQTLENPIS